MSTVDFALRSSWYHYAGKVHAEGSCRCHCTKASVPCFAEQQPVCRLALHQVCPILHEAADCNQAIQEGIEEAGQRAGQAAAYLHSTSSRFRSFSSRMRRMVLPSPSSSTTLSTTALRALHACSSTMLPGVSRHFARSQIQKLGGESKATALLVCPKISIPV